MKQFLALQILKLEVEHLHVLLRSDSDPQKICPKRFSLNARKALKNVSPVVLEE